MSNLRLLRILSFLYFPFIVILSYIVPKQENLYLFGSKDQDKFMDNPKYLYLHCSKDEKIQAVFATRNPKIKQELEEKNLQVEINFWKKLWLLLRARYIFLDHYISDVSYFLILPGRFTMIQLYHGTPLKKIEIDDDRSPWWYLIATRIMSPRYNLITCNDLETQKNYGTAFNNKNVIPLGFPRNDIFFDHNLQFNDIKAKLQLAKLQLDKYAKTILYAPTWRDYTTLDPFSSEFLSKLNRYCAENNYLFLIKQHPYAKHLDISSGDSSHILDISSGIPDPQELLIHMDMMIVDYSSIFFDYVLTKKPIIYYPYDKELYLGKNREMYFDYDSLLPGPFAENEDQVLDLIQTVDNWFNQPDYQAKYKQFADRFNIHQDDQSSARIIEYIQENL